MKLAEEVLSLFEAKLVTDSLVYLVNSNMYELPDKPKELKWVTDSDWTKLEGMYEKEWKRRAAKECPPSKCKTSSDAEEEYNILYQYSDSFVIVAKDKSVCSSKGARGYDQIIGVEWILPPVEVKKSQESWWACVGMSSLESKG